MPRKFVHISSIGKKFGRWKVLEDERPWFLVECECGFQKHVRRDHLFRGLSKGCYACVNRTHGMDGTPVYNCWAAMLYRCRNPKAKWYHRYGGRGITVCKEWESFEVFFAAMGEKPPKMTLERRDNDGPYCKENCYWAPVKAQIRNREKTPMVQFDGRKISVAELAELHGLRRELVYDRILRGWSIEEAISTQRRNQWGATKSKVKT